MSSPPPLPAPPRSLPSGAPYHSGACRQGRQCRNGSLLECLYGPSNLVYDQTALARGNWFRHARWVTNNVRTDIAVVCRRTPEDLEGLVRRVPMQIETFAAGRDWQVLVVGCQLKRRPSQESMVHWIKCPRSESLCGAKVKETNENLFPLQEADLAFALEMLERSPPATTEEIVRNMEMRMDVRASRCTYIKEQQQKLQVTEATLSWGRIFTAVAHNLTPFLKLRKWTSPYGSDRGARMVCATRTYLLVHLLVACAVVLLCGRDHGLRMFVGRLRILPTAKMGEACHGHAACIECRLVQLD
ncbi:hypothetical protein Asppvi_003967 [Aspergillus pseudoviridinutans]|uniref:Uncharacterized protein n=1 Tax=Aspergillus pseudoviridinutans TaxID=1517512 RepID=A0A9P3B5G2_9EURO|nr:uncharacterized protein Asppvi_003967 [Aspergillus pseudoviridinutans]GIJ85111.1 hypothetical protein Asppvi_003967 [Aspergillus pseudoviridinutans]